MKLRMVRRFVQLVAGLVDLHALDERGRVWRYDAAGACWRQLPMTRAKTPRTPKPTPAPARRMPPEAFSHVVSPDMLGAALEAVEAREKGPSRARLVHIANEAARLSRVKGALRLTTTSSAEEIAAWLQWCDPNGAHTAELAQREGAEPYDDARAWEALASMIADDVDAG